jgi:uncharacterized membrane protein
MDVMTSIWDASPWVFALGGSTFYYYGGLVLLVAAMIWAAVVAHRSWEEAHEELDPATREELLDAFVQARAEGELDEEEFARIRRRLGKGN